jgi:hypothetical protein
MIQTRNTTPSSAIANTSRHDSPVNSSQHRHRQRSMSIEIGRGRRLTNVLLLHPGQRRLTRPCWVLVEHLHVADAIDRPRRTPELDRRYDQSDHPQHEQHEGTNHNDGWQQAAVVDEPEEAEYEHNRVCTNSDEIWEVPGAQRLATLLNRMHSGQGAPYHGIPRSKRSWV